MYELKILINIKDINYMDNNNLIWRPTSRRTPGSLSSREHRMTHLMKEI